jgi:hypothetical protein
MTHSHSVVRLLAAQRLQRLGWALVHYAQAVERAIRSGEPYREEIAKAQRNGALQRLTSFFRARDAFRGIR